MSQHTEPKPAQPWYSIQDEGDEKRIQVIELFGPTIQGEGLLLGVPTHFLRTGGCGYRCSWCDSMHAVLPSEVEKNRTLLTAGEIMARIESLPPTPWLTLTGGDPAIQNGLADIIEPCWMLGMRVAIETQGQFWPPWMRQCDVITLSPKGPSSGMNTDVGEFMQNLSKFRTQGVLRGKICIKVVVFDKADLDYAFRVKSACEPGFARPLYDHFTFSVGSPLTQQVKDEVDFALESAGFPPEERNPDYGMVKRMNILGRYEWLVDAVLSRVGELGPNVTITPQQHTLLWPLEERGR